MANAQDMIKWGTDYFLKCLITSGGVTQRFYGQVGDGNADHAYWGRPEEMTMSRPAFFLSPTNPGIRQDAVQGNLSLSFMLEKKVPIWPEKQQPPWPLPPLFSLR